MRVAWLRVLPCVAGSACVAFIDNGDPQSVDELVCLQEFVLQGAAAVSSSSVAIERVFESIVLLYKVGSCRALLGREFSSCRQSSSLRAPSECGSLAACCVVFGQSVLPTPGNMSSLICKFPEFALESQCWPLEVGDRVHMP